MTLKSKAFDVMDFDKDIKYNEDEIKKLPFGFQINHREMGWKNLRRGNYEAAIRDLHHAAGVDSNDIRTLIGRSYARSKIMLYEGANQDANAVIRQDSYNKDAIFLEAFCANDLGLFEQSLLMYRRGVNKRGRRREFLEGQQAMEATLENTVGRQSGSALTDLAPVINMMKNQEEHIRATKTQKERDCLDELYEENHTRSSDEEWYRLQKRLQKQDAKMARIYLGKLAADREWCKEIINTKAFKKNDTIMQQIIELVTASQNEMDKRLENLHSRKPLYHFRHRFKPCLELAEKRNHENKKIKIIVERKELRRKFKKLEELINEEQYREAILQADSIKDKLDKLSTSFMPEKQAMLEELSRIMCNMYLKNTTLRKDLSKEENRMRLKCMLGLDQTYLEMRQDSMIQKSSLPFLHYSGRAAKFKEYVKGGTSFLEKAWLHYECAYMYSYFLRWDHAVQEATKCVSLAVKAEYKKWVINALLLIVQGETQRRDRAEALKVLKECTEVATELGLEDSIAFLMEVRIVIGLSDEWYGTVDPKKAIKKREKVIIGLIEDLQTREQMRDLLARMRSLPAHRRMPLIPGINRPTARGAETTNKSIIPGGIGGRLGMHPITNMSYKEFLNLPSQ